MLDKVLETSKFVVDNAKQVTINYDKVNGLIDKLLEFNNVHYLTKVPYPIYDMETCDIVNFLLIYDSIDFSFWGNPKWTIDINSNKLDGGIALLHCIYNLFEGRSSLDVYKEIENMSLEKFRKILNGNVEIPLLKERYNIIVNIAKIVNKNMNGNFYSYIKNMDNDKDIFNVIIDNFSSFQDIRKYKGHTIYFYKLAQLLTSDILHVIERKENRKVNYSNLVGCTDYKIPQVLEGVGILEYDDTLSLLLDSKTEMEENSEYEVEIRASMLVVINYIYERINRRIE